MTSVAPTADIPPRDQLKGEEAMNGYTVSTACGRSVLIRPCVGGSEVQFAVISTYGNIVEAVNFDAGQLPGVLGALEQAQEDADREHLGDLEVQEESRLDHLIEAELAANTTHCLKGHELTPENSYESRPGVKGCRQCRGEQNVYWRKENGLAWR